MTLLAAIVLNALWQDALLVALVWLVLRVFPRVNAATRYVVWSSALIAAVAVPAIATYSSFVPARAAATSVAVPARQLPSKAAASVAIEGRRPVTFTSRKPAAAPKRWVEIPDRARLTIPVNVARAVVAAWALLAAYSLFGLLVGLWRLERLKRDALPLPVDYRDAMPEWQRANKGRRAVRLCVSDAIDVPVAIGLFDSMVLIPRDLLERLSPGEVEQISLHELAHLRRGDDWSNCLQRLIVAALGWNPAAHFVAQQLELEREVACDDWVLSSVQSVRPYALCLTKMAETAAWPHHPMPAPGVFTTRKQISLRIERLLASGRDIATTLSLGPAAAAVAGVAAAAFVIAMVAPSIAAPSIEPIAPVAPVARIAPMPSIAPIARTATRVKTIERIRIIRVTPVGVATPFRITRPQVNAIVRKAIAEHTRSLAPYVAATAEASAESMASSAEKMAMDMADDAIGAVSSSQTCAACDYHGVNWAGRDLHGVHYSAVDFSRATLTGVNLSDSRLSVVDFARANLTSASFRNAHLNSCDFSHATLVDADFSGATLSECTFGNARLDGAKFNGAKLVGCDLSGVDLHRVDLSHAQIVDYPESLKQPPPP